MLFAMEDLTARKGNHRGCEGMHSRMFSNSGETVTNEDCRHWSQNP